MVSLPVYKIREWNLAIGGELHLLENNQVAPIATQFFMQQHGNNWHTHITPQEYQTVVNQLCQAGKWIVTDDHRAVWWTSDDISLASLVARGQTYQRDLTEQDQESIIHSDDDNIRGELPNSIRECMESWKADNKIIVDYFNFDAADWRFRDFIIEVYNTTRGNWCPYPVAYYTPEAIDIATIENDEIPMTFSVNVIPSRFSDVRLLDNNGNILGTISLPEVETRFGDTLSVNVTFKLAPL